MMGHRRHTPEQWRAHWAELRVLADDAMKALARLPSVIDTMGDDPDHLHETLVDLSASLTGIDCFLGTASPCEAGPVDLSRITRAGGRADA